MGTSDMSIDENNERKNIEIVSEIIQTTATMLHEQNKTGSSKALNNVIDFRNNLSKESDRGVALMGTAYIDDRLAVLLKAYFVDDKKVIKLMFDFTGPLGTFSSRLNMAYSLGLMSKNIYTDCNILKKIRNDFAHVPSPINFDDEPIKSRCHALVTHGIDNHSRTKARFTRTIMSVLLEVETMIEEVTRCTVKEDFDSTINKQSIELFKKFIKEKGLEFEGYEDM